MRLFKDKPTGWHKVNYFIAMYVIYRNSLKPRQRTAYGYYFWEFESGFTIIRRCVYSTKYFWRGYELLINGDPAKQKAYENIRFKWRS